MLRRIHTARTRNMVYYFRAAFRFAPSDIGNQLCNRFRRQEARYKRDISILNQVIFKTVQILANFFLKVCIHRFTQMRKIYFFNASLALSSFSYNFSRSIVCLELNCFFSAAVAMIFRAGLAIARTNKGFLQGPRLI